MSLLIDNNKNKSPYQNPSIPTPSIGMGCLFPIIISSFLAVIIGMIFWGLGYSNDVAVLASGITALCSLVGYICAVCCAFSCLIVMLIIFICCYSILKNNF